MPQNFPVWIFALFAVLILFFGWLIARRLFALSRRKRQIADWAMRSGMEYAEGPLDAKQFGELPKFQRAWKSDASNIARGSRGGYPVRIFDVYTGTKTDSASTTTYSGSWSTAALIELPGAQLPYIDFNAFTAAKPDSFQGKLFKGVERMAMMMKPDVTGTLVEFPDYPGFLLLAKDPEAVKPIFSQWMLQYFAENVGFSVEAEGSRMVVSLNPSLTSGRWKRPVVEGLLEVSDFEQFLNAATEIARKIATAAASA